MTRCPSDRCSDVITQGTRGLPYTRPPSEVVAVEHDHGSTRWGDGARVEAAQWFAIHVTAKKCRITPEQGEALRLELSE